ncbi:PQQ-binding-like beta-propeller repeat protein [Natronomonas salina]|uniref:outer membrane protein assembly factor BamB family protein n=1 Tax=Natronomonas salina TaxID=1710540 RepID=UPI0015B733E4|nr:PQQ-binding-like beta-propeller repeat protein [Natronomonas salina]QLD90703.1 PQQ-binding-like beta-propeller repeat protein [Natronomonas salina]
MPSRRSVLAGAGTLAGAGLAGCLNQDPAADVSPGTDADTEWPQPGGTDRYDCYLKDAAAPREEPSERWTAETSSPVGRPVVADGRVLLFTLGGLYAYDLESGEEVWRLDMDDVEVRTSPTVVDGTAYLGVAFPHGVLAVDVEDGSRLWHAELQRTPSTAPVVDHRRERLAVGTHGRLAGVDVEGEKLWSRRTFSSVSALTSWGDSIYAGTEGGELYCFYNYDDPRGRWRRQLDGTVEQIAQLNGSDIVVSVFGGPVERRDDSEAGASRWSRDTGFYGFVAAGNTYAVGHGLASISTRTGERHWTVDDGLRARPAGAGDTVYTGGEGFVAAFAMDGGIGVGDHRVGYERWRHGVDGEVFEGVSVADGAVFATAADENGATLYALE